MEMTVQSMMENIGENLVELCPGSKVRLHDLIVPILRAVVRFKMKGHEAALSTLLKTPVRKRVKAVVGQIVYRENAIKALRDLTHRLGDKMHRGTFFDLLTEEARFHASKVEDALNAEDGSEPTEHPEP